MTEKLYKSNGKAWMPVEAVAKGLDFKGVNGHSRMIIAAIKSFGLLESSGSDLRVSDLAQKYFHPKLPLERLDAVNEMMFGPKIYAELGKMYAQWNLPSDDTLSAVLLRDYNFTQKAVSGFIEDLRKSIAFLHGLPGFAFEDTHEVEVEEIETGNNGEDTEGGQDPKGPRKPPSFADLLYYSRPGARWSVSIPNDLTSDEAKTMKRWVSRVLIPQLDDVIEGEATDEY